MLYKQQSINSNASSAIEKAGGALVYAYPQIGVVIATSDSSDFRSNLLKDSAIENAAATTGFAYQLPADTAADAEGPPADGLPNAPATDADTLSPLQWDMRQIHAPEAHAITGGSPAVLVGDIDTGIDFTHPDLVQNIDVAHSANCVSGAPVPGLAAQDDNGHGTHTAGTIAAASNGIGIVGVAPNVKVAGIKAGNAAGYFFPEAVICSFVWAGDNHMDVTNNSYFADPFLFNCRNDPVQRAIWKAEQRAIRYAMNQGVTVVSADGNESEDLSHPTMDTTSPDDSTPVAREVTNACVVDPRRDPRRHRRLGDGQLPPGHERGAVPRQPEVVLLQLRHQRHRCHRAGRRLALQHAAGPRDSWSRPLHLAGGAAGELPRVAARLRPGRAGRPLVLPAGDVDGLAARGGCSRADRQPLRGHAQPPERKAATGAGGGARAADGGSAGVP